jgi:hypothetical protein
MEKLDKNEIIKRISENFSYIKKNFGVVKIGLIGSYARDEQNNDSDIDIIVELIEPRFDYLAGLLLFLESKFDKKVDLLRKGRHSSDRFLKRIAKDVIYV